MRAAPASPRRGELAERARVRGSRSFSSTGLRRFSVQVCEKIELAKARPHTAPPPTAADARPPPRVQTSSYNEIADELVKAYLEESAAARVRRAARAGRGRDVLGAAAGGRCARVRREEHPPPHLRRAKRAACA